MSPASTASDDHFQPLDSGELDALTLGRLTEQHHGIAKELRYGGEKHVLVFGPNGKGKGTRILIPNLLQMRGNRSIVVVDPKGELAAVTAPFRRTLGRVVVLNPFNVVRAEFDGFEDLASCGYNPLAAVDPAAPDFNARAALLAEALITVGDDNQPHFPQSARALVAALLMYIVIEARNAGQVPKLSRFRELLCQASDAPHAGNDFKGVGIPKLAAEMMKSSLAGLRNKAAQFTDWNREIQSIASTARIQTEPLDDTEIAADLDRDGFDFRDLRKEPTTVYLVLPPEMMGRHSKWLRLVIATAIQSVLKARKPDEPRVLFMLDEFFALGHLEVISTVWALVRGYGISIMPVLQDLGQLKKLYPDLWETFIGMAGAVVWFAPNDLTTAEYMSRRAGDTTRTAESESASYSRGTNWSKGGWGGSENHSTNTSASPVKVPLIPHHELFGLHAGTVMLTIDGLSHIVFAYAPAYYRINQCIERARRNPYFIG